jgi:integrase/recombinase XerD
MENYWAETTYIERKKKLKFLARTFYQLKLDGLISTTNPRKMSEKDIDKFIGWMKDKKIEKKSKNGKIVIKMGYDPQTKHKLLNVLNQFFLWCDNPIIDKMRKKKKIKKGGHGKKIYVRIPDEKLELIKDASKKIDGWPGIVAQFITAFYPATGLRPKELRLAHVDDIDTSEWNFWVRHPKGEDSYGRQRDVFIPSEVRPDVIEYLKKRQEYLNNNGFYDLNPLIPSIKNAQNGYFYSDNAIRGIKRKIENVLREEYGVDINFKIRDFRPTYAHIMKEKMAHPEILADQFGSSVRTIEKNYARISSKTVRGEMEKLWSPDNKDDKTKKSYRPPIKSDSEITGYI